MSTEDIGEWKERKQAQAVRFVKLDPSLTIDSWGDFETKFVLVHHGLGTALVIGQLAHDDIGQPRVDLTDEQIAEWAAPLRVPRKADV